MMGPMGVTLDETSTTFARLFGSLIISIPVLLFFVHKSQNTEFRKAVVYCVFTYLLLSTIILLIAQLKGLMNPLGWGIFFDQYRSNPEMKNNLDASIDRSIAAGIFRFEPGCLPSATSNNFICSTYLVKPVPLTIQQRHVAKVTGLCNKVNRNHKNDN